MIKIALCDSDEEFLNSVERLILERAAENYRISIDKFTCSDHIIDLADKGVFFDIIVTEAEFGSVKGIEMVYSLRKHDSMVKIIFLASDDGYCVESYRVGALSYMLKPIDEDYFTKVLLSGISAVMGGCYVCLPLNYGAIRRDANEIEYICVYDKCVEYHFSDGTKEHYTGSLRSIEKSLDNITCFYKALRSIIINMDYVEYVKKGEVRMRSGFCFIVSRKKSKKMTDHILSYFNMV